MRERLTEAAASAPGKLILFGEHSVVYGHPAVAAAISDMRITVHAAATRGGGHLNATLADLRSASGGHVSFCAPLAALREALAPLPPFDFRAPAPPPAAVVACLERALAAGSRAPPPPDDMAALVPLLFLCAALLPALFTPQSQVGGLELTVRSKDLPVGAGLGSSAAFSVALAGALLRLRLKLHAEEAAELAHSSSVVLGAPLGACEVPCAAAKQLINGWAYAAECILHGTPSGLDNAVSCEGFAMRLCKSAGNVSTFERVRQLPQLRVLLTNTKVPRRTREKVAAVKKLHEKHPHATSRIFESIGAVTEEFLALASRSASFDAEALERIGSLVTINHHLLCALGVGAPELEQVRALTEREGLPTKLTGAGGGGCAFTIIGGETDSEGRAMSVTRAKEQLECCGFECFETVVGGEGVLWHTSVPSAFIGTESRAQRRWPLLLTLAGGVYLAALLVRVSR
ncbi:hypothetical protein AB1Y20_019207 [Prymnesium parvum]|uniref:Mevalonate kinase n=1 Tax=Prymnesium parvum TaxID=97485 RepID=A0AB34JUD3_PRYPA